MSVRGSSARLVSPTFYYPSSLEQQQQHHCNNIVHLVDEDGDGATAAVSGCREPSLSLLPLMGAVGCQPPPQSHLHISGNSETVAEECDHEEEEDGSYVFTSVI